MFLPIIYIEGKGENMSNININYNFISSYHEGKKGYIDKYEKSLKLPFLNVLQNHMPLTKPAHIDESDIIDSDISISDNIELNSAVTGATETL